MPIYQAELKKKQPVWIKQKSLTNILHRIWKGRGAFLARKSFYVISSPPWLEPQRVWLKWDWHLLGSAAARRLLSDFVSVLMHSGAKILTSTTQKSSPGSVRMFYGILTFTKHSMEESINAAYRLRPRVHESSRAGVEALLSVSSFKALYISALFSGA